MYWFLISGPEVLLLVHPPKFSRLLAIGLDQFDAGYLGDCVPLIGSTQWPRQQRSFGDRLLDMFGVNAGRAKKQQFLSVMAMRRGNHIGLNSDIFSRKSTGKPRLA
jgi:hypothetical protein